MDGGGRFVRPVTQVRKPRETRGKSGRSPSRGIARGPVRTAGRRKKAPGFLSRLAAGLKERLALRRPMLWMTLGIVAFTLLAGLFASGVIGRTAHRVDAATEALIFDSGFGVGEVHLSGNSRTSYLTIMAALGLTPGQSIFGVDLRAARARLMQLPWVADARVTRRYPNDISVRIVERVAYARWQASNGLYVVERSGRPITDQGLDKFQHLPLLLGQDAPRVAPAFVDAVAQHRAIVARVQAYQYQSERRWNLLLDDGVIVKLPESGWRKQLDVLDHLIVDKGVLESDIREIDLRSPGFYFFVRKNAGEKAKKPETGSAI
jgi:cell division protein FtsQ